MSLHLIACIEAPAVIKHTLDFTDFSSIRDLVGWSESDLTRGNYRLRNSLIVTLRSDIRASILTVLLVGWFSEINIVPNLGDHVLNPFTFYSVVTIGIWIECH